MKDGKPKQGGELWLSGSGIAPWPVAFFWLSNLKVNGRQKTRPVSLIRGRWNLDLGVLILLVHVHFSFMLRSKLLPTEPSAPDGVGVFIFRSFIFPRRFVHQPTRKMRPHPNKGGG